MKKIVHFIYNFSHFLAKKIILGFQIPPDALVLDVGSGDKPFWRANCFVDDLRIKDDERASGGSVIIPKSIFVDSSVECLPFPDGIFDFVYCSHLIEHVDNPQKAIAEMRRVTKPEGKIYLEFPNAILESIFPFPGHKWLIFEENEKCLHFVRKSQAFHNAAQYNDLYRRRLLGKYSWNGTQVFIKKIFSNSSQFDVKISCPNQREADYNPDLDPPVEFAKTQTKHELIFTLMRQLFLKADNFQTNLSTIQKTLLSKGFRVDENASIFHRPQG